MHIAIDGPSLSQGDASGLWNKDKQRCQVAYQRATPRSSSQTVDNDSSDGEFDLKDWESYVYQWTNLQFSTC